MRPLIKRWLGRFNGSKSADLSLREPPAPSRSLDQDLPADALAPVTPSVVSAGSVRGRSLTSPVRDRLEAAFTPLRPISTPSRFTGRRDSLRRLVDALDHEQSHVVVCGERGVGKTSLLRAVAALAQDAGHLTVTMPCSNGLSFDEVVRHIAESIPLLYHKAYSPLDTGTRGGGYFGSLLSASPQTVAAASTLLSYVTGIRVLVILDEFQRVSDPVFSRQIAELMKNLSDADASVQFVISGTAGEIRDLFIDADGLGRGVMTLELPRLDEAEVGRLISDRSLEAGVAFDAEAVDLIVRISRGLPSMVALLSYHAAVGGIAASASSISATEVDGALSLLSERARNRISTKALQQLETELSPDVRRALCGMAMGNGHPDFVIDASWLTETLGASKANQVVAEISNLADRAMLIERRGVSAYRFLEPAMSEYLWMLSEDRRPAARLINRLDVDRVQRTNSPLR